IGTAEIISGQKVRFTNNDVYSHTATSPEFSTGNLNPGQSAEIIFNTPGTYTYICLIHSYMNGTVKVLTSNSTTTPTPTTTRPAYNQPPVYNPPSYDYGY
ncbi:MAG: cupredoxin domain-containing protein, partial [Acidimicrobiales bacterium]|nr:cupredoxin domain-containing protein [Acidimicrobiales bacterium]